MFLSPFEYLFGPKVVFNVFAFWATFVLPDEIRQLPDLLLRGHNHTSTG
jgi:hypothetical protein